MQTSKQSEIWFMVDYLKQNDKGEIDLEAIEFETNDPFYFSKDGLNWVKILEDNWQLIKTELDNLITEGGDLKPYFQKELTSKANTWKTFTLFSWGIKHKQNCQRCPQTTNLLESIPGMVSGSFSMLEPQSKINWHRGDTNGIIRSHLGLDIPAGLPYCGFQVGDKKKAWEKGKLLLFCDAHKHTAWNNTSDKRYILLVDVVRHKFINYKNYICSRMIAYMLVAKLIEIFPFLTKGPLMILVVLLYKFVSFALKYTFPVIKKLKFV